MKRLLIAVVIFSFCTTITPRLCFAQTNQPHVLPLRARLSELADANIITLRSKDGKIFYEFIDSCFKKSKSDSINLHNYG